MQVLLQLRNSCSILSLVKSHDLEVMKALRVFERKILNQINSPAQKEKSWRTETNKELQDKLQGTELCNI